MRIILGISICLSFLTSNAQVVESDFTSGTRTKVQFLFQSLFDSNKFELAASNDFNIMYISEKCSQCLSTVAQLEQLTPDSEFIVILSGKTWKGVRNLADANTKISQSALKRMYFDPGDRFKKAFKLGASDYYYMKYSQGRITKSYDYSYSRNVIDPFRLKIWY